jgi:hypothetical protein
MDYLDLFKDRILARKPFTDVQLKARKTKGGTYILTSPAVMNDDDRDRDLTAITAYGEVVKLHPLANAEPLIELLNQAKED